jgi:arabinose-5-phosphate isomerase
MTLEEIVSAGRRVVQIESAAVSQLMDEVGLAFAKAVKTIHESAGRVIITGIGKSAIIAQKIVATMNSTGTPAIFMHAADAIHGDLGIILKDDTVICISKSGNTPEIKVLIPLIKNAGNTIVGMTSDESSYLGTESDIVLHTPIQEEACPNGLAPTTSTTVQLVMGDAVAIALLELKGFTEKDFAKYHPGGALGKKLYLKVSDLTSLNARPEIGPDAGIREVIVNITENRLGATVITQDAQVLGIITDGDLRRMLSSGKNIDDLKARDIMSPSPVTIDKDTMAVKARRVMDDHNISQLIATNDGKYAGIVHVHDLIQEGIV